MGWVWLVGRLAIGTSTHRYKISVFCIPDRYYGVDFFDQLLLLIIFEVHVPFGKSCFPCPVLDQNEPNLASEVCARVGVGAVVIAYLRRALPLPYNSP